MPVKKNTSMRGKRNVSVLETDQKVSKRQKVSKNATLLESTVESGSLFTFGTGDCGQLGLGENVKKRNYPCLVPDLKDKKVIQVTAGGMHTVALTATGEVWTFGVNDDKALGRKTEEEEDIFEPGQVELSQTVVQISAGDSHTAALTDEGLVYAWGSFKDLNGNFGLVPNNENKCFETPQLIMLPIQAKVKKIASGDNHLVLLTENGTAFTFGSGEQGQLGRDMVERVTRSRSASTVTLRDFLLTPQEVVLPGKKKVEDIWAGGFSTCFRVEKTGHVWVCGLNNHHQLGVVNMDIIRNPTKSPGFNFENRSWTQIAAGMHHTVALTDDGKVFTLGRTNDGRTGLGSSVDAFVSRTTLVPKLAEIKCTLIGCGLSSTYAVSSDGELYAWGFGSNYQLGTGSADDLLEPQKLSFMVVDSKKVDYEGRTTCVSGGGQHVCVIIKTGKTEK